MLRVCRRFLFLADLPQFGVEARTVGDRIGGEVPQLQALQQPPAAQRSGKRQKQNHLVQNRVPQLPWRVCFDAGWLRHRSKGQSG